jgi:hypothetical protein
MPTVLCGVSRVPMNRFNTLHLLGLTALIAVIMFYQTVRTGHRIDAENAENIKMEQLGKALSQMKTAWDDSKRTRQRIDRLLSSPVFKPYVTKTQTGRESYKVTLQAIPAGMANRMTGKMLNESLAIKQLDFIRNSDENISMTVEFAL